MARAPRHHSRRRPWPLPLAAWLAGHRDAAFEALERIARAPLASAMTVAAIAIALALPAALFVALDNLERLAGNWQRGAGLSVFLAPDLDETAGAEIADRVATRADVAGVELVSRAQGLAEFRDYSGLGAALDQLPRNPLPVVLAVEPAAEAQSVDALDGLRRGLEAMPEVEFARLDMQWARRFDAILALLGQGAWLLAAMLGLGVLLVVGNTVRLEIEHRRGEVQIMDLVGATPAFIRRPFLYVGAGYGLLGGILAWALVALAAALLQGPVSRLAALYDSGFPLHGLGPLPTLALLGVGSLLGMVGSWLAVDGHLRRVRPD